MKGLAFLLPLMLLVGCSFAPQKWEAPRAPVVAEYDMALPAAETPPGPAVDNLAARPPTAKPRAPLPASGPAEKRKMIYQGKFVVLVADRPQAQDRLKEMAEQMGGYLQSMNQNATIVRVPAGRFEEAATALTQIGVVADRQVQAQDVTEDYADLELRLKNAKALKQKILDLIKETEDLKSVMELEKELSRITVEIEQFEITLVRLGNQVAFATLTVEFRAPETAPPRQVNPRLPFDWLQDVGLQRLMNFSGRNLY